MQLPERIIRVGADALTPLLSVLTPFHRDDPSKLIAALGAAPAGVEFVMLDDGSRDVQLLNRVVTATATLAAPVRIIVRDKNAGRAAARNRLIAEARGRYVLFLDADMIPDQPDFLARWLRLIERKRPLAAFGGLSVAQIKPTRETALHYNLFAHSDCAPAKERAKRPAQTTASANLLVRRAVFRRMPFDAAFKGWGFEDTDWALRISRHTRILHINNPATHAGLDTVETLLRKSAEAGPNFARLVENHPVDAKRFAAYRAARALKRTPARSVVRALAASIARSKAAPMSARRAALKIYRAAHYAEHLS